MALILLQAHEHDCISLDSMPKFRINRMTHTHTHQLRKQKNLLVALHGIFLAHWLEFEKEFQFSLLSQTCLIIDESFGLSMPQALISRNSAQDCPSSPVKGENISVKMCSYI